MVGKTYFASAICSTIALLWMLCGIGLPSWDKEAQAAKAPEIGEIFADHEGIGNSYLASVTLMAVGTGTVLVTTFLPRNGVTNGIACMSLAGASIIIFLCVLVYAAGDLNINVDADNVSKWGVKGVSMWFSTAFGALATFFCGIRTVVHLSCGQRRSYIAARVAFGLIVFTLFSTTVMMFGVFTWKKALDMDPDRDPYVSPMFALKSLFEKQKAKSTFGDRVKGVKWESQVAPFVAMSANLLAALLTIPDLICLQSGQWARITALLSSMCSVIACVMFSVQSIYIYYNMREWSTPVSERWGWTTMVIALNCISSCSAGILFFIGVCGRGVAEESVGKRDKALTTEEVVELHKLHLLPL